MVTQSKYKSNKAKLSVTVSGDIGEFTAGDVLTTDLDIAEYFRTQMLEGNDGKFDMDDAQIIGVVRAVPYVATEGEEAGSSDWDIAVCLAIEARMAGNVEPTEVENVTGRTLPDTRSAIAVDLAPGAYGAWLDQNEAWRNAMHKAAMAPIDNALAPLHVGLATLAAHGVDIKLNGEVTTFKSDMDGRPIPGSEPSDKYLKDNNGSVRTGDRYLFARYKIKPKGSTTLVPYDYWKSVVDATAEGKAWLTELGHLKDAMPGAKEDRGPSGPYAKYSKTLKQGMKRKAEMGYNGMSRGIQAFIGAWFVMRDIGTHATLSKNIGVAFQATTPGREPLVIDSVQPIVIWDKTVERGESKSYTVTSFANLDIEKAIAAGGTYTDVIESTKAGPNESAVEGIPALDTETLPEWLNAGAVFFGPKLHVTDLANACRAKAGKGETNELGFSTEANDLLLNAIKISRAIARVLAMVPGYAERSQQVEELRAAQETARDKLTAAELLERKQDDQAA